VRRSPRVAPPSFLRDRFNFFKDYSPADGGDVIKLIRVVYKSFSEHVMDAARRGSLTVRPEVFLNPRGVSSSKFSRQGAFSRARAFRGWKNEKQFTNATRAANGPPDRADSIRDPT